MLYCYSIMRMQCHRDMANVNKQYVDLLVHRFVRRLPDFMNSSFQFKIKSDFARYHVSCKRGFNDPPSHPLMTCIAFHIYVLISCNCKLEETTYQKIHYSFICGKWNIFACTFSTLCITCKYRCNRWPYASTLRVQQTCDRH